jgi:hypothetical protein
MAEKLEYVCFGCGHPIYGAPKLVEANDKYHVMLFHPPCHEKFVKGR